MSKKKVPVASQRSRKIRRAALAAAAGVASLAITSGDAAKAAGPATETTDSASVASKKVHIRIKADDIALMQSGAVIYSTELSDLLAEDFNGTVALMATDVKGLRPEAVKVFPDGTILIHGGAEMIVWPHIHIGNFICFNKCDQHGA